MWGLLAMANCNFPLLDNEKTYELEFIAAYVECALWSSIDPDNDEHLNSNYSFENISEEGKATVKQACKSFLENNKALLNQLDYKNPQYSNASLAGHDFWLTRNEYGTGFWDRGLGKLGKQLTAACKIYKASDCYLGDDKLIYFT